MNFTFFQKNSASSRTSSDLKSLVSNSTTKAQQSFATYKEKIKFFSCLCKNVKKNVGLKRKTVNTVVTLISKCFVNSAKIKNK